MNPHPQPIGQRRIAREDCEIGDWVDSIVAPEWSADLSPHTFRREEISISPVEGSMGGILPDQSGQWTFIPERRTGDLVWVRES